jgi:hypothetical protein
MYRDLVDCLFRPERLETVLHVMILSVNAVRSNALMYFCSRALRHAVAFGFTETGIVPFKESPDIIVPYEFMSKDQLAIALSECRRIEDSGLYVCSTKMKTGFFVSAVNEDKYYICKHAILAAVQGLLCKQAVGSESMHLVMHRLIGDCVSTRTLGDVSEASEHDPA